MRIAMNQFGTTLCTRASGRAAYSLISATLSAGDDLLEFDFSNVDTVTNSFADEAFGRLVDDCGMSQLRIRTTFKNINRNAALMIRCAMDRHERSSQLTAV